jgi:hypothetical protein
MLLGKVGQRVNAPSDEINPPQTPPKTAQMIVITMPAISQAKTGPLSPTMIRLEIAPTTNPTTAAKMIRMTASPSSRE